MFLNLLNNAIDAVEADGSVAVSCFGEKAFEGGQPRQQAVVVVEDSGHGMSSEVQRRVFEPFFSTKPHSGTGLGLSVSHWILRRHDAQIQLQSEPGRGTRFRVVFAPLEPQAPAPSRAEERGGDKDTLTILVVDDDHTVAEMLSDLLIEQGHTVTVVSNAADARNALAEHNTQLVITDLDLPDISGWQLARQVREQQPGIAVGMITGWPIGASQEEMRARGVDFVLSKPFSIDALLGVVNGVLRR